MEGCCLGVLKWQVRNNLLVKSNALISILSCCVFEKSPSDPFKIADGTSASKDKWSKNAPDSLALTSDEQTRITDS